MRFFFLYIQKIKAKRKQTDGGGAVSLSELEVISAKSKKKMKNRKANYDFMSQNTPGIKPAVQNGGGIASAFLKLVILSLILISLMLSLGTAKVSAESVSVSEMSVYSQNDTYTGSAGTSFNIYVSFVLSSDSGTLNNATWEIKTPAKYVSSYTTSTISNGTLEGTSEDGDDRVVKYSLNTLTGGASITVPLTVSTKRGYIPDGTIIPITEILKDSDGNVISEYTCSDFSVTAADNSVFRMHYRMGKGSQKDSNGVWTDYSPKRYYPCNSDNDASYNVTYAYEDTQNEGHFITNTDKITYDFTLSNITRYYDSFTITDTIPEGATFNASDNPEWVYDESTRTATYKKTGVTSSGGSINLTIANPSGYNNSGYSSPVATLILSYAGAGINSAYTNEAQIQMHQVQQGDSEEDVVRNSSVTLNLNKKNRPATSVSVDSYANAAKKEYNAYTGFPSLSDHQFTFGEVYAYVHHNSTEDLFLRNVFRSELDSRLKYSGVEFGNRWENYDGKVDIIGYQEDGTAVTLKQGIDPAGKVELSNMDDIIAIEIQFSEDNYLRCESVEDSTAYKRIYFESLYISAEIRDTTVDYAGETFTNKYKNTYVFYDNEGNTVKEGLAGTYTQSIELNSITSYTASTYSNGQTYTAYAGESLEDKIKASQNRFYASASLKSNLPEKLEAYDFTAHASDLDSREMFSKITFTRTTDMNYSGTVDVIAEYENGDTETIASGISPEGTLELVNKEEIASLTVKTTDGSYIYTEASTNTRYFYVTFYTEPRNDAQKYDEGDKITCNIQTSFTVRYDGTDLKTVSASRPCATTFTRMRPKIFIGGQNALGSYYQGQKLSINSFILMGSSAYNHTFKDVSYIALLPDGVDYVKNSLSFSNVYFNDANGNKLTTKEPEIKTNYKGTGQTALIWKFGDIKATSLYGADAGTQSVKVGSTEYKYMFLIITFYVTPGAHTAEGSNKALTYFSASNLDQCDLADSWTMHYSSYGNGATITDENDLDNDSDYEDKILKFEGASFTYVPPKEILLYKDVKGNLNDSYSNYGTADAGANAEYKLTVFNNTVSPINTLTVLDLLPGEGDRKVSVDADAGERLERGSTYSASLRDEVSVPEGFTAYYTTDEPGNDMKTFTTDANWNESLEDYSKATAIKIVMDEGESIPAEATVEFTVPVKTPAKSKNGDGLFTSDDQAVNSFGAAINTNLDFFESNNAVLNIATYNVSGTVFKDRNKNGVLDDTDLKYSGQQITLADSVGDPVMKPDGATPYTAVTDENGHYSMNVASPGSYRIKLESALSGMDKTTFTEGTGGSYLSTYIAEAKTGYTPVFSLNSVTSEITRNLGLIKTEADPATEDITGEVSLTEDGTPKAMAKDQFSFTVTETSEDSGHVTGLPASAVSNAANGTVDFGTWTFTKKGTYTFEISQTGTAPKGYTYDTKKVKVTAVVTDNDDVLEAEISYEKQNASGEYAEAENISFNNTFIDYETPKAELDALKASKTESDYDPEDWTDLVNAVSDGKDNIDAQTTTAGIKAAKDAAIEIINGIKTKADKVEDLIDAIPSDPTTTDGRAKVSAARAAYDALTDAQKEQVENYRKLTDAEAAIYAADLAAAKAAAKAELDTYLAGKSEDDYFPEDWSALTGIISDGKDDIDSQTKIEDVTTTKEDALERADAVKTKVEKTKDLIDAIPADPTTQAGRAATQAARETYDSLSGAQKREIDEDTLKRLTDAEEAIYAADLAAAKEAAKAALDTYLAGKSENDYYPEDWEALTAIISDGKDEIDSQTTIEGVTNAKGSALEAADAVKTKAERVEDLIEAIPEDPTTQGGRTAVINAREAYNELSADQKSEVSNYSKLTDAEAVIAAADLAAAKEAAKRAVDNAKNSKDESDYYESDWNDLVKAASDGKDNIDAQTTIPKVGDARDAAIDAINSVKTKAERVTDEINALPADPTTEAGRKAVEDARRHYDALTNEQKNDVADEVLKKLTDAESAIAAADLAAAKEAAKKALDDLKDSLSEDDYYPDDWQTIAGEVTDGKTNIDSAETIPAVNAAKQDAVDAINAVKTKAEHVTDLIDAIPSDPATPEGRAAAEAAREAYDALTADQRSDVSNYSKLTDAEAAIASADLAAAKEAAKKALDDHKAELSEDDYYADDWQAIAGIVSDGKDSIDEGSTISEVNTERDNAIDAMDAVKTKAEKVEDLIDAIPSDPATPEGRAAADAAREAYDALSEDQKEDVSNYSKLTDAEAAIAAADLAAAKQAAKEELAGARAKKNDADYDDDGISALDNAVTKGNSAIDAANSIDAVNSALADAKDELDSVKTIAEKYADSLTAAKEAARKALDDLLASKNESDYDPEDWEELVKAITDGKAAIDVSDTLEDVSDAQAEAENRVAEIKTKAQKAEEALNAAKEAARAELDNLVSGKNESDYDPEDWQTIIDAASDGKSSIDAAESIPDVETAKTDAEDIIGGVKTKAQKDAEDLAAAKEAGKKALDDLLASKTETDYDPDDWVLVNKLIDDGKAAIDAAETIPEVDAARVDTENRVAAIKTKAQKTNDDLNAAKEAAKAALDRLYLSKNESDYDPDDWKMLGKYIFDGKDAIDAADSVAGVDAARIEAENKVGSIKTKAQKKLEEDQKAANEVRNLIISIPDDPTSAEGRSAVSRARTAYDQLTDDQKMLVDNYKRLTDAEAAIRAADSKPAKKTVKDLKLRSPKQTNTSVTLKWTKTTGAARYVVYGNSCGATKHLKKIRTVRRNRLKLTKIAGKKVKKGTYYKMYVKALDKDGNVIGKSQVIHVATKGGKVGNPTKLSVKVSKKTLKPGDKVKIKARYTKPKNKKVQDHVTNVFKYSSSNKNVAKVSKSGKITTVSKGTATITVYTQNGIRKTIKITVSD